MNTPASLPRLGFIGLGAMGGPMARNLLRAGYPVSGYDLDAARLAAFVAAGGTAASTVAGLAREANVVCTSLPSHEAFAAVAGRELLPVMAAGQVLIDFGTTIPHETQRLHAQFAARGVALLDVPVSGGAEGAARGWLRMFAGGDRATFERVRPVLEAVGGPDKLTYCGPSGSGQIAKGVNQLKSALQTAAQLEALAFAIRAGVPAETIAAAFGAGPKGEASTIVKFAQAVAANRATHFGLKFRELPYFLAEARHGKFPLPLTEALFAFCDAGERVTTDDNRPAPSFWYELMRR